MVRTVWGGLITRDVEKSSRKAGVTPAVARAVNCGTYRPERSRAPNHVACGWGACGSTKVPVALPPRSHTSHRFVIGTLIAKLGRIKFKKDARRQQQALSCANSLPSHVTEIFHSPQADFGYQTPPPTTPSLRQPRRPANNPITNLRPSRQFRLDIPLRPWCVCHSETPPRLNFPPSPSRRLEGCVRCEIFLAACTEGPSPHHPRPVNNKFCDITTLFSPLVFTILSIGKKQKKPIIADNFAV